ncbi:MAG: hypothetical protein H6835_19270 [Planctomycetes bacterium]|nr:hypothetical protein [Planctomycetota bacterium]
MISNSVRLGRAVALAFAALSPTLLAPTLLAQGQLAREITFVRSLAKEMRFIELAKAEADRLASEYRGAGDQDKIAQLAVEVAYYGARSRNDRDQQRQLFKETVEKSQELVDRTSDDEVKLEAMTTLANASQDFGQFLIEELEIARQESPDKVKELTEEASKVLRNGIEACGRVKEALRPRREDPEKEIEFFLMWMKEGVLTREQGRADKENRSVLIDRAIEELTEMVLEAGEETAIGLRGMFEIAQCYEVAGQMADAIGSYVDTIDQISTSLTQAADGELNLPGEVQAFLFDMLQEVYVRAGETMAREGAEGTAELFAKFHEAVKKFGEEGAEEFDVVSPTFGHMMLLAEARFHAESGDAQKVKAALAMAQKINDKHPADFVGIKAKQVLSDILGVQQSLVSGSLLFEVGKGQLQNQEFEEAIKSLRHAVGVMSDDEKKEFAMEAWQLLGQAYGRTDRFVEAMLCMEEGIKAYLASGVKDEAAEGKASDLGDQLDRTVSLHKRLTKEDTFFTSLWEDAVNLASKVSTGGANKLAWKSANELLQDNKFAEAAAEFAKVQSDYVYYEQALVRVGRAQAMAGDFAAAKASIESYRDYVKNTELNQRDTGKQQVRTAAIAANDFNEVWIAYYEARGSEEFKLQQDLAKYDDAIAKMDAYMSNHAADGDTFLPQVLAYEGRLHTDKGDFEQAEATYAQLKQKDSTRASRLATEIFKEYQGKQKMLTEELDKAIKEDKPKGAISAAEAEVKTMTQKLTALGSDYIQNSPRPQLAVLIATMQGFESLGEWKKVDDVAKKSIDLYGADEQSKDVVDKLVRPMVGEALMQQRRFQEAYDMLLAAETANPDDWELKRQLARALGGWFEFSSTGAPVREPGLDKPIEAYMKYYGDPEKSYRIWMSRPEIKKFSLEWYRFMWESYWFAKQAGKKDGKFNDTAGSFYRLARSTDDFATLRSYGAEGLKLLSYFQTNR